ncbi:response regulator receiver protein [Alkaliphilus metalliredigens QYMF]|uniref:Stage 0 sporulation protein A homolog n=1 Tax=Alkaliphilus metalliredigens (strain QYMF) TaxID=293826 RepID=A6TRR6_ALKMQ|nr:response regulator [Alkaliphilus metalliredigens]ABR48884.1 response regulator receiver protein [Alkaliphilus metalliredigens QYMF]
MGTENLLRNIKVLYVEDEPITRNQVSKILKKSVGKLITAENGKEGIEKFFEYQPDIIITDLIMGDISGIEMMEKLRAEGIRCPFIITSAISDSQTILETVELKIEKYLIKPIDVGILIENLTQIAIELLEKTEDLLIVNKDFILVGDKKNELELEIRNLYSKYLKKVIGKGAKLISVFINGREVEILLKQTLTTLEENLLATGQHYKLIEIIRKSIYENTLHEFASEISCLIDRKIEIKKIEIYPKEKFERVILQIK